MITSRYGNLNPFPFFEDFKKYSWPFFRGDLIAAISVALLALPQAMAYAFVAELPPSAGIFAAIFGTIFTAAFCSSPRLISGPTIVVSILIQSGVSEILYTYYPLVTGREKDLLSLQIILQTALVIGIFQIIGGLLRLGRLTQFASRSVIVGYMAGAAIVIAITQLYYFFGIREMDGSHPPYQQAGYLVAHLLQMHIPTALIGLGCLTVLVFFHRISEKIPGALVVFLLSAVIVATLGLSPENKLGVFDVEQGKKVEKVSLLEDFGPVYTELPHFEAPKFDFRILLKALPLAFAILLLSALEVTSIGRSYAKPDEHYSDNQEIYGLGVSNFLSAFLGAMPSAGSFSRSALNVAQGGKTRFAAILSGICLFIIILSLGFLVTQIPLAALSALMLLTAYTMVNFEQLFICLRATRMDGFVVLATICASLLVSLDVAFYIGIALSIVLYLKQAGIPYIIEYTFNNMGKLRPMEENDKRPDPRICIIQAEGELFFGAAEPLFLKIREIVEDESLKIIILQFMNARHMDASVCMTIQQIDEFLKHKGRVLLISGVTTEVDVVMQNAGIKKRIGVERFFSANEKLPSEPTRNAYAFAKSLLG